eukprot:m.59648 g.59648  ORF g.59648 m.59648 type:complete len:312 (+) comp13240_c0_seq1:298-1233(+)
MVPLAVLLLPFVLNVGLCLVLEHGPDFQQHWRQASPENIALVALVLYSLWICHSLTYARFWDMKWSLLAGCHLLCKTAFHFSAVSTYLLTVADAVMLAVFVSVYSRPSLGPQLTLIFAVILSIMQYKADNPEFSLAVLKEKFEIDTAVPWLTLATVVSLWGSFAIDQSLSASRVVREADDDTSRPNGIHPVSTPSTNRNLTSWLSIQTPGPVVRPVSTFIAPRQPVMARFNEQTSISLKRRDPADAHEEVSYVAEDIDVHFGRAHVQDIAYAAAIDELFISFNPQETGLIECFVTVDGQPLAGSPIRVLVQ